MTHHNNRRTLMIAAIVLVVVAAVAAGLYRAGTPTGEGPSTPTAVASTSGPTASYSPTDQYGSPEPSLESGTVRAGEGGSTTGPAGLPLGYPHDDAGAVSAATNYLMWMNSIRIVDKPSADAMAASVAVDQATREALIHSFDQLRTGMTELTADQPQPARGAYAIASYSADRALIYIWAPEVTTDRSGQTNHLWAIDAVQVVRSDGDWKLDQTLITNTGAAAVDPSDPAGNPTAAEKHSILTRTPADPGEITDTADQRWLEYANAPH